MALIGGTHLSDPPLPGLFLRALDAPRPGSCGASRGTGYSAAMLASESIRRYSAMYTHCGSSGRARWARMASTSRRAALRSASDREMRREDSEPSERARCSGHQGDPLETHVDGHGLVAGAAGWGMSLRFISHLPRNLPGSQGWCPQVQRAGSGWPGRAAALACRPSMSSSVISQQSLRMH